MKSKALCQPIFKMGKSVSNFMTLKMEQGYQDIDWCEHAEVNRGYRHAEFQRPISETASKNRQHLMFIKVENTTIISFKYTLK